MNRQRVAGAILTVGGLFITLASLPHAFLGWPALRDGLQQGQASPDTILTAASGWLFGSFAMATLGIVALVSASQLRRGHEEARWQAVVVGASYVLFGAWAMYYVGGWSPLFFAFMALGAAVGVGAWFHPSSAPRPKGGHDHEG
mgnify:CR=1 FL=1